MIDSTHCSQCNALLIEIDFYGERMQKEAAPGGSS
jgi:hypothetical protein